MILKPNHFRFKLVSVIFFSFLISETFALTKTDIQTIKETLIRLEEGQKAINQRINDLDKRIDGLDKRIDGLDKRIDMLARRIDDTRGLLYVILAGMFTLVGFVIWDRRSALSPLIRRNKELEYRQERLEKVLKEFALQEPKLVPILKRLGIL